jgi:endoglucanase
MAFTIRRGVNISHWLSQTRQRGAARAAWFTERDVGTIAGLRGAGGGYDHLRLPVDEVQLWDEDGRREEAAWELLDAGLDWCEAAGLRAIVDLHITRSHYFNDRSGVPALFTDPAQEARFAGLWRELSERLHGRANDLVAYELLNEAVARDPEDWNRVALTGLKAVRASEPERTIVLGSNWFNQFHTFERLTVPDDPNLVLTYHYYSPMLVTHHQAMWWPGGFYDGPIHYPGVPVTPEDLATLDAEQRALFQDEWNAPFGREQMIADLAQPLAVRERTYLPLYCGEFGCYEKTPQPLRLAWYADMMAVFDQYEIAWANWDYKGSFGIVTADGQDTGLAEVLLS